MTAEILKIETGEVRTYRMPECKDEDANAFIWEDGNFACDCNREAFFEQSLNPDYDEDTQCGDERFAVLSVRKEDGERFYWESRAGVAWG